MLVATALFLLLMILVPVFKSDELVDPGEDYVADTTGKKKSKLGLLFHCCSQVLKYRFSFV